MEIASVDDCPSAHETAGFLPDCLHRSLPLNNPYKKSSIKNLNRNPGMVEHAYNTST